MSTTTEHAVARGQAMRAIQTCTACPRLLTTTRLAPVVFSGPSPNPLMLLGDMPSPTEDRYNRLMVGGGGKHLAQLLVEAHLPPLGAWFVAKAVCCAGASPVAADDLAACLPNLRAQLAVCDPDWIVTLGAEALKVIVPRSKVTEVHGRPFLVPAGPFHDRWVFPTFHPSIDKHDEKRDNELRGDLSTLSRILDGRIDRSTLALRVGRGGKLFT